MSAHVDEGTSVPIQAHFSNTSATSCLSKEEEGTKRQSSACALKVDELSCGQKNGRIVS